LKRPPGLLNMGTINTSTQTSVNLLTTQTCPAMFPSGLVSQMIQEPLAKEYPWQDLSNNLLNFRKCFWTRRWNNRTRTWRTTQKEEEKQ